MDQAFHNALHQERVKNVHHYYDATGFIYTNILICTVNYLCNMTIIIIEKIIFKQLSYLARNYFTKCMKKCSQCITTFTPYHPLHSKICLHIFVFFVYHTHISHIYCTQLLFLSSNNCAFTVEKIVTSWYREG